MCTPQPAAEVAAYLSRFAGEPLRRLEMVRDLVASEFPEATESISYGLLAYKLHGKPLVYFGGFAHHTGMYATPVGHEAFAVEFAQYKQGKGSVQFPLVKPFPLELVKRVIEFRAGAIHNPAF